MDFDIIDISECIELADFLCYTKLKRELPYLISNKYQSMFFGQ